MSSVSNVLGWYSIKTDPETFCVRGAFFGWVGGLFCFQRGAEHRNCDISVVSRMLSSVICVSLRVGYVQLRLVPHTSMLFRMMDFMAEMTL